MMDLDQQIEAVSLAARGARQDASKRPMHAEVYHRLRNDIEMGVWRPTDLIPTEIELGRRFGVSPGTVKQAVLALVREGLLTRRSGKGTFVNRLDFSQSLMRFFRFYDSKTGAQLEPKIRFVGARIITDPPQEVANKLTISRRQSVLRLERLMTQDELPVCLHVSFFPNKIVRGLEHEDLTKAVLYDILHERFGINIMRARELLSAVAASKWEASLLKIRTNHPVILIERTAYTYGDKVVEWRKTIGRSDHFHYKAELP
jgi:GntR family transcriptional regulator